MIPPCGILVSSSIRCTILWLSMALDQSTRLSNQSLNWTSSPPTPLSLLPLCHEHPVQLHAATKGAILSPHQFFCFIISLHKLVAFIVLRQTCSTWSLDIFSSASRTFLPGCPVGTPNLPSPKLNSLSAHSHTPKYVYFFVAPLLVDDTTVQPLIQMKTSRLFVLFSLYNY